MKHLHVLAVVALLLAVSTASYYFGRESRRADYEAACLLADFIHHTTDYWRGEEIWDGGVELENSFYEYFGDLDDGIFETKRITREQLYNYSWCY